MMQVFRLSQAAVNLSGCCFAGMPRHCLWPVHWYVLAVTRPPFQPLTAKRTSGLSAVFVLVTGDLRFDPDLVRLTKDQYGGAKCDTAVLSAI